MSTFGIDYSEIGDASVKSGARSKGRSKRGRRRLWLPLRVVWWAVLAVVLAVLAFLLLIRGGGTIRGFKCLKRRARSSIRGPFSRNRFLRQTMFHS